MITIMDWLILGTEHQARYFSWRAPLAARIVVEWMFMSSGWTKLHNFPVMIENFAGWGISFPSVMKPFVLGLEFVGGSVPVAWFAYTDLRADARRRHAVAAIRAKWGFVDSLETLLGFEEVA